MKKLKELITIKDRWTNAEGENDGLPFFIRFRPHLKKFTETKIFNGHFKILWNYNIENSSQIPDDKEMTMMSDFEAALVKNLEDDLQAILSFVYTGQNQREWHWYSHNIDETQKRLNKVLADFSSASIQIIVEDDPNWNEYNEVLEGNE